MKRRRRPGRTEMSIDSILDIITNVVGVMILVAVAAAISSQGMQISVGLPRLQDPPRQARRILFECAGDRVIPVDEEKIDAQIMAWIEACKQRDGKAPDLEQWPDVFNQQDFGDACYRVTVRISRGLRMEQGRIVVVQSPDFLYTLRDPQAGENQREIQSPNSVYQRTLQGLGASEHFLFFAVREDSFEVFRLARKIARRKGLAVGWHPRAGTEPLTLSAGGGVGDKVQHR